MEIRVIINGALGKMGREIAMAVDSEPGMKIVGATEEEVAQHYFATPETSELVPFSSDLDSLLKKCRPDVVVDFTNAEVSMSAARIALKQNVNMVIGTTGLSEENLAELSELCRAYEVGAVVAPNFSLGAALLIQLCKAAAGFFAQAEIVEMHHDKKIDAPSGTAIATARAMSQAHAKPFIYRKAEKEIINGTRGGQIDGIAIHSIRLPGFMACQEVILSGPGETLSLRHETINRECYMPGVILATKEVVQHKGLIYGLDALLDMKWKDLM